MASGKWISTVAAGIFQGSDGAAVKQYPASTFTPTKNGTGNFTLSLASTLQTAWSTASIPLLIQLTPEQTSFSDGIACEVTNVAADRIDCRFYKPADGSAIDPTRFHILLSHFNDA